jgi:hypothetical protein
MSDGRRDGGATAAVAFGEHAGAVPEHTHTDRHTHALSFATQQEDTADVVVGLVAALLAPLVGDRVNYTALARDTPPGVPHHANPKTLDPRFRSNSRSHVLISSRLPGTLAHPHPPPLSCPTPR